MTTREILATIGTADLLGGDLVVQLGDRHPTQHAPMRIRLVVDDSDVIVGADAEIGFMHRSAEKLFEVRDYRQVLMLANRHDWINPLASEIGLALVIEDALGIVPPERATWSRTLLAELTRVSAAAMFVGAAVPDADALRLHAQFLDLLEQATGQRVHPMFVRIGGLAAPLDDDWLLQAEQWLDAVEARWPSIAERSAGRWAPLTGVAVLPTDDALAFGVTGPVLRASGVSLDLRTSAPSLAYAEIASLLDTPVGRAGDVPARYAALVDAVPGSVAAARASLDRLRALGPGPIDVPLPKVVRLPELTRLGQFEGPLGITSVLLDSVGDKVPWRLKLATPSFAAAQAMAHALRGVQLTDLADAVGSFFIVVGDADR